MSQLVEIERARLAALIVGDVARIRQFHHPDFQLITPRGVALSLDQYLDEIASGGLRYLRWEPDVIVVRENGDIATLRYSAEIEIVSDGHVLPVFRTWHTDTYERHAGVWQVVWSQATLIS